MAKKPMKPDADAVKKPAGEKRPRGRPPRPDAERPRSNLTLRIRDEVKAAIEKAAALNGRSLSEEIEMRIEFQLRSEGNLLQFLDLAFGTYCAGLILLLGKVIGETAARSDYTYFGSSGLRAAQDWPLDPYTFDQVAKGVSAVMETLRPDGDVVVPQRPPSLVVFSGAEQMMENLGAGAARSWMLGAIGAAASLALDQWGPQIADRLGPEAARKITERLLPKMKAPRSNG